MFESEENPCDCLRYDCVDTVQYSFFWRSEQYETVNPAATQILTFKVPYFTVASCKVAS